MPEPLSKNYIMTLFIMSIYFILQSIPLVNCLNSFGYSVSVLCDSHVTRQRPLNIRKMNFGVTDDNQSYEGFN